MRAIHGRGADEAPGQLDIRPDYLATTNHVASQLGHWPAMQQENHGKTIGKMDETIGKS